MILAEKVLLRPIEAKDLDQLYVFKNDRNVTDSLGGFSTGYSKADLGEWLEFHRKSANEILWCIADSETDQCIGHIGLYNIDHRVGKAELALLIGPGSQRGKGLGLKACQVVIDYAFRELALRRIELSLLSSNLIARKLYDKLGFVQEGVLKEAQYRDGQYVDIVLMALFIQSQE